MILEVNRPSDKQKGKKNICGLIEFVPFRRTTEGKLKKKTKKIFKYLDLARGLENLKNMRVKVIALAIATFGTVLKGFERVVKDLEITALTETIQIPALFRSARKRRRLEET